MSLKKATPKAVFDACEQLELLERPWNRDDVRLSIGGGSFSVIDPLIQAWRKLQPIREVAPSVPTDLLIQVASMLEQQVSGYIAEIELRDQEREAALLEVNKTIAENLQQVEFKLTEQLELSQQANHELEAELARLTTELDDKNQSVSVMKLKLQVSEEAAASLNLRLKEQQAFYESTLKQQKEAQQESSIRAGELHQQNVIQIKQESQQQLAQQKSELIEAGQIAENRLMRLLDQGRGELKELNAASNNKIEHLGRELQTEKQLSNQQALEMNSLSSQNASFSQAEQQYLQKVRDLDMQLSRLTHENESLKGQLQEQQSRGSQQEKSDLQQLKDSIRLLQNQMGTHTSK
ncbi:hypothetical protein OLEAN_C19130 [Oleispira antarctica RB-8]|uniref:KfrA N-terminal DNA-binding domain-containing protein n=1 Tax=Oleispira antarctica RB-8 TaxID=698738 RepID=R4YTU4_OLEAN|nr:hypothetical protein OLEAN_C19130 [Oleispira antarctica RB-8]